MQLPETKNWSWLSFKCSAPCVELLTTPGLLHPATSRVLGKSVSSSGMSCVSSLLVKWKTHFLLPVLHPESLSVAKTNTCLHIPLCSRWSYVSCRDKNKYLRLWSLKDTLDHVLFLVVLFRLLRFATEKLFGKILHWQPLTGSEIWPAVAPVTSAPSWISFGLWTSGCPSPWTPRTLSGWPSVQIQPREKFRVRTPCETSCVVTKTRSGHSSRTRWSWSGSTAPTSPTTTKKCRCVSPRALLPSDLCVCTVTALKSENSAMVFWCHPSVIY